IKGRVFIWVLQSAVMPAWIAGIQTAWMRIRRRHCHPWRLDSGSLCRNDDQKNSSRWFLCKQTENLEMRRPAFARDAFAGDDFQSSLFGKAAQLFRAETQVAVVERFDRRAMRMLAERGCEQASARLEHARGFC